ncbi:hypothetical protein KIW84_072211 [Lathyrus oleraceus]|uniref:Uncharacterized protein n=1 Tax=Pisum sativum TaxID=3888 RepID=A0A9D4ZWW1_PEA|nr:hypothetical protein KIW84_072211 [Pisum sativum]
MYYVYGVALPLTIAFEKFVDFNEFRNHGLDLLSHIRQDASCIKSNVFGISISLTSVLIAKEIVCEEVGVHMDMYPRASSFLDKILDKILATKDNLASVSSLLPKAKILHQLLLSNFHPREDALETLTYVDKHLIFFILLRTMINLPLTIFKFLRKKIIASHEKVSSLIPFERVLSEIFLQVLLRMCRRLG